MTTAWHAELAWLGGPDLARDVLLVVDDVTGRLVEVTAGAAVPEGARSLAGIVLPGLVNRHSHAFHRALRGRAAGDDFWGWRAQMYDVADRIDPDVMHRLARATFGEMALAGITEVHEFHYLHHDRSGRPYADPNAMSHAIARAAGDAGVRLVLVDTCYLRAGFDDAPLDPVQQRFSDGSVDVWAHRLDAFAPPAGVRVAAGAHSVRALAEDELTALAAEARRRRLDLHLHLSEQPRENDDCRAATGRTPAQLVADCGLLGPQTTAVHATHLTGDDIARLGQSSTTICLCPTTERDLGDGVGPAAALAAAGCPLGVGSDSQAVIDLFEEARAIEADERLTSGRRGLHAPPALLAAATASGGLAAGAPADLCVIDPASVRLAGITAVGGAAHVIAAAAPADVTDVVAGGRAVVREREHVALDVARELRDVLRQVWS
ncbi:MAG TPA: formimidoylglutamate deiminase [Mycobacteriales bacterium]|nr:formimidoylglutamate deiminase [Mycobacteriales bacterium]